MSVPLLENEATAPNIEGLITWLLRQAREGDQNSRARTALAELRRGLRDDPRDQLILGKYVTPFLSAEPPHEHQRGLRWREECCFLVAALFASHPMNTRGTSLGAALGALQEKSGSIENRFLALLATRPERLRVPLRQAISLLAANTVALDWKQFLIDLTNWGHPDKLVQQRWARHFYRAAPDAALDHISNGELPDED